MVYGTTDHPLGIDVMKVQIPTNESLDTFVETFVDQVGTPPPPSAPCALTSHS